ncbi:MAG: hypothetical protein P8183_01285 [Anaerolineae bacterium]
MAAGVGRSGTAGGDHGRFPAHRRRRLERLEVELLDDNNQIVAEQELPTRTLAHNQTIAFRFEPQRQSAGRHYTLQIGGSADNPVSVWGYSLDVYGAGSVVLDGGALATAVPATPANDLRLVTRYQLTWPDAITSLGNILWYEGLLILLALFFLPLPGVLLLLLAEGINRKGREKRKGFPLVLRALRFKNSLAWWGVALSVGTAVWPLLWLALN